MLISHSHRFIFVHVYKAGGTSVRAALSRYAHQPERSLVNRVKAKIGIGNVRSEYPVANHADTREIREHLPADIFNGYFKFSFVRNPWDWHVSIYHFMLQSPEHFLHETVKAMQGFGEFVEYRVGKGARRQKDFLSDERGNLLVDVVGRIETIENDFQSICNTVGIRIQLPHHNRSRHDDYRSYYTKHTRRLIEEHFREDIELFGYNFDGIVTWSGPLTVSRRAA